MSVQPGDSPLKYLVSALASEPILRKNLNPSGVPKSKGLPQDIEVAVPSRPHIAMKLKVEVRKKAPLWWVSSPMNQSAWGACGETALSAGWAPISPSAAKYPP